MPRLIEYQGGDPPEHAYQHRSERPMQLPQQHRQRYLPRSVSPQRIQGNAPHREHLGSAWARRSVRPRPQVMEGHLTVPEQGQQQPRGKLTEFQQAGEGRPRRRRQGQPELQFLAHLRAQVRDEFPRGRRKEPRAGPHDPGEASSKAYYAQPHVRPPCQRRSIDLHA